MSPGPQLLHPCSRACKLQLIKPVCLEPMLLKRSPLQWEIHALQLESSPHLPQLVKNLHGATKPGAAKKSYLESHVYWSITHSSQDRKQLQCPSTGEQAKKIRHILSIYNGIKSIREKDMLPFVTAWLDLEGIMLSEKSLREKDKYCMILPICRIWKSRVGECVKG